MTQDPNHVPQFVNLARVIAEQGRPFMCIGGTVPYCAPFKAPAAAANDEGTQR